MCYYAFSKDVKFIHKLMIHQSSFFDKQNWPVVEYYYQYIAIYKELVISQQTAWSDTEYDQVLNDAF